MGTSNDKNQNYGYQPGRIEERGYQPTNPGNGYQPATSSNPSVPKPAPPSTGSSVKK